MSIIHSKELKIELLVGLQEHLNIFMGEKQKFLVKKTSKPFQ